MAITFEIRISNGYAIHVLAISGRAKLALAPILPDLDVKTPMQARHIKGAIRLQSERIKRLKSLAGARAWIERFKALPFNDQMFFLRDKWMKPVEKDFVAIKAQHYQLHVKHWNKDVNHGSTINKAQGVEALLSYGDKAHLVPTIGRNMVITKSEYAKIKDKIEEKRIDPDGIVGMCQDVKKTRRNRLKGQDRHSGYRSTTSPNFFRGK